jgi:hypothetical protein
MRQFLAKSGEKFFADHIGYGKFARVVGHHVFGKR